MSGAFPLVLREIAYRKGNFVLSAVAVVTAVALFVAFYTTAEGQERETRRVTRDLGFNLRIVPRKTDLSRLHAQGFSDHTLPEEAVERIASRGNISYNHLVAVLQKKVTAGSTEVILTGLSPERAPPGRKKPPMTFRIEEGTVHVGPVAAAELGARRGGDVEILGRRFRVARILGESGTDDDIRVFGLLSDVQHLLGLEGRINEIKAIDCLCMTPRENPLAILRSELEEVVPEARVILLGRLAETRARQRRMVEGYFAWILPCVLVVCAAWIAILSFLNVRERRREIGVLRALGHGSGRVLGLFISRAVLVGLAGAAPGFPLGSLLAFFLAEDVFPVTADAMEWSFGLLGACMAMAPLFAVVSSFVPAIAAATRDPAAALRDP